MKKRKIENRKKQNYKLSQTRGFLNLPREENVGSGGNWSSEARFGTPVLGMVVPVWCTEVLEDFSASDDGESGVKTSVRGLGGEIAGVTELVREQGRGVGSRGGGARFTVIEDLGTEEGILQALSLSIDTV